MFGSAIILTCTVELNSAIVASDLSSLMVDAQLSRNGTPLTLSGPTVTGTTFNYIMQVNSFSITDAGNYTCNATVRPQPNATYLNGSIILPSNKLRVTSGDHSCGHRDDYTYYTL